MRVAEGIPLVQKEFFELYWLLSKHSILKNDVISMGNLALFVDYSLPRYKWKEKKKQIIEFAEQKEFNEVNMLIADYLYEIAIRLEISDNLPFKLKKMSASYKKNKLYYFDVVLDPYEFPGWFKRLMEYQSVKSEMELYTKLLRRLGKYDNLEREGNEVSLSYFSNKIYRNEHCFEFLAEFEDVIENQSVNDFAWLMAKRVFGYYYLEMGSMKKKVEQDYALEKLKEYKQLYEQNQLDTFDLFTESMKEQLIKHKEPHI